MPEIDYQQLPVIEVDPISDLDGVGPEKPMGYLAQGIITGVYGLDVDKLAAGYRERGLVTEKFSEDETRDSQGGFTRTGALYVYDHAALQTLLDAHTDVLSAAGWPHDPEGFVKYTVKYAASGDIGGVVARAFADPRPEHQGPLERSPVMPDNRRIGAAKFLSLLGLNRHRP